MLTTLVLCNQSGGEKDFMPKIFRFENAYLYHGLWDGQLEFQVIHSQNPVFHGEKNRDGGSLDCMIQNYIIRMPAACSDMQRI